MPRVIRLMRAEKAFIKPIIIKDDDYYETLNCINCVLADRDCWKKAKCWAIDDDFLIKMMVKRW